MPSSQPSVNAPLSVDVITRNVRQIADLESKRAGTLSRTDAIGGAVSRFVGSLWFSVAHVAGMTLWVVWNTRAAAQFRFDPYPFGAVNLLVSLEGVLLATFILIAQNRQGREADRRNHLALQISILAEQEMTAVLRQLDTIAQHVGARREEVPELLMADTEVSEVLRQIDEEIAGES
ncbi:MAG: DUF1003 domain-containing protein [Vicinamibacterales bacterium]